jgi:hypothetical protein
MKRLALLAKINVIIVLICYSHAKIKTLLDAQQLYLRVDMSLNEHLLKVAFNPSVMFCLAPFWELVTYST